MSYIKCKMQGSNSILLTRHEGKLSSDYQILVLSCVYLANGIEFNHENLHRLPTCIVVELLPPFQNVRGLHFGMEVVQFFCDYL
jgi:hypothetical protein